jgi:hypothetical protein
MRVMHPADVGGILPEGQNDISEKSEVNYIPSETKRICFELATRGTKIENVKTETGGKFNDCKDRIAPHQVSTLLK